MARLFTILLGCLLAYAVPRRSHADCLERHEIGVLDLNLKSKPNATFPTSFKIYHGEILYQCQQCPAEFNRVIDAIVDLIGPHVAENAINQLQYLIDDSCCKQKTMANVAVEEKKTRFGGGEIPPKVLKQVPVNRLTSLGFSDMTICEILAGHRFDAPRICPIDPSIEKVFAEEIALANEPIFELALAESSNKKAYGIDVLRRFALNFFIFFGRVCISVVSIILVTLYTTYLWFCVILICYGECPSHDTVDNENGRQRQSSGTMIDNYDADDEQSWSLDGPSSELDVTMDDVSQSHA